MVTIHASPEQRTVGHEVDWSCAIDSYNGKSITACRVRSTETMASDQLMSLMQSGETSTR